MSRHMTPFFCPYCGDEAIRPYGETHGEWHCESCRRAFALRSVKQTAPIPAAPESVEAAT
jgi:ribosomal protein L37AE/L43A